MLTADLKQKIEKMCNYLWAGGLSNPADYIEQISYLLFLKMLEDRDNDLVKQSKLTKRPYKSIFDGKKEQYRWSIWSHKSGKELLEFVKNQVFPFMTQLNSQNKEAAQYFKDAYLKIGDPVVLKNVIGVIDQIDLAGLDADTKGDLYEYLLSQISSSGRNGQFRTPRHIIRFIVQMVNPLIGETVCDPACGTAGFLIGAYNWIRLQNSDPESIVTEPDGQKRGLGDKLSKQQWEFLENRALFGYDIDPLMIRLAMMNLMLHGLPNVQVRRRDAIAVEFEEDDMQFDVVVTNPPFAGSIDRERVKKTLPVISTKTEILFLGHVINLLRDTGRCGIVVPEGLLFGTSSAHREIRRILLEKCKVEAVVSLPSGCFKPYSGVITSVLIFTKGKPTENVWFYELGNDGFSLDDKRAPTPDKDDIPDLLAKWLNKEVSLKSWIAKIEDIRTHNYDLSAGAYKPQKVEKTKHEDPDDLIAEILELEQEINDDLQIIKKVLTK